MVDLTAAAARTNLVNRALTQITERRIRPGTVYSYTFDKGFRDNGVVLDRTKNPSMWLIRVEYISLDNWTDEKRKAATCYLCGNTEGRDWAVRVPSTFTTVEKALNWITPAAVKHARAAGKKVLRQGDMYFVPIGGHYNNLWSLEATRHTIHTSGLVFDGNKDATIKHPQHKDVVLKGRHRAYGQRQLGDRNQRGAAD